MWANNHTLLSCFSPIDLQRFMEFSSMLISLLWDPNISQIIDIKQLWKFASNFVINIMSANDKCEQIIMLCLSVVCKIDL